MASKANLAWIWVWLAVPAAAPAATLHVAADGRAGALPSLQAARDRIRELRKNGTREPMTVLVHGGTYFMAEALVFTPEDSGVTYAAFGDERPVLSGGRKITGWGKAEGRLWKAPAAGNVHQLFIGGRRAQRARTPNKGFLRVDGKILSLDPFRMKFRGNDLKKSWAGDAEMVMAIAWQEVRSPILEVDEEKHEALIAGRAPKPASNMQFEECYWIENAPDGLDMFGEWRLDRKAGMVYYNPMPGEDMTRDVVIAPALMQLVRLEGDPTGGALVRNIAFRGLDFRHADWSIAETGYAGIQAGADLGAAFEATGAEGIAIENCRFTQCGLYAISFGRGSRNNRVVANEIFDMGAGGIKLGEPLKDRQRENPAERTGGNIVTDNEIHTLGLVFPAGVGVAVLQSSNNTVAHNHVHDLFYTAISVGWTWFYRPDGLSNNIIEYNHLHDLGQNLLSDMGGIYTLGIQPGTVLRNNLIHDVNSFVYGGWGIYMDQASSNILIENNIVYKCRSAGFNQNFGRENTVRNNIFALNKDYQMMRNRSEQHLSFTVEKNIIYFDQGRLLGNNWTGWVSLNRNIYWDARGGEMRFGGGQGFDEWRKAGQDADSMIADPRFVNAQSFDFRLRPDSPALKMGFRQIDMSTVGPRVVPGPAGAPR